MELQQQHTQWSPHMKCVYLKYDSIEEAGHLVRHTAMTQYRLRFLFYAKFA